MKAITIIGSGLGGLTSGALLAKKGYKVTMLEQHDKVGGAATTFARKGGFTCEVGLHEMNGIFEEGSIKEIFNSLGVYDNITFVKVGEFFKVLNDGFDFTMPDDKEEAILALIKVYPAEEKSIKKYFTLIGKIAKEFDSLSNASWWQYVLFPFLFGNILRYKSKSVREVLDKSIKDESLKLLLNTNVGYYHDTIAKLSFLYHAIAQHSYYEGGGWYIKGGSGRLSAYLASIIRENGGEVITKAEVIGIGQDNIVYRHKKEEKEMAHEILISNLSPSCTYKLANIDYEEEKEIGTSLLTVYLGFKNNLKSVYGKRAYSTFLFNGISSMEAYDKKIDGPIGQRGIVFVDYSQIDSGLTTDTSKSFGVICTIDHIRDWESLSMEAYKAKKDALLEDYLIRLEKVYPNIKEHIEFSEIGTAKTMQRYLKTPEGTAYGFAPTHTQFFRVPEVKSKKRDNLYFVGAWIIGGGFTPAILSGDLCASEVLKKHAGG